MKKYRLGIIGSSEIAFRRFLPALKQVADFEYKGLASRNIEKTQKFIDAFGGKGYGSYDQIIQDQDIDILYIPLPPALHFEWAKKALDQGKHVFLEKPSTTSFDQTEALVKLAQNKGLVLRENYMFTDHSQLKVIDSLLAEGKIGDLRLIRVAFGFPRRAADDFRYNKDLGGGALLDCGGYTLKVASHLLGEGLECKYAKLEIEPDTGVDLYGNAILENQRGVAQISFGMDNAYKCELEIWGQNGFIKSPRIFTPGPDFEVVLEVEIKGERQTISLPAEDQFYGSILHFKACLEDAQIRERDYQELLIQARLVDQIQGR